MKELILNEDKLKDKDKMRSFLDYFKELVKGLKASPNN